MRTQRQLLNENLHLSLILNFPFQKLFFFIQFLTFFCSIQVFQGRNKLVVDVTCMHICMVTLLEYMHGDFAGIYAW